MLASADTLNLLFFVALLGLCIAIFTDHLQLIAKYRGALQFRVASGYNLAMKVMVFNRVGAVLYFLIISFCIDNEIDTKKLALGTGVVMLALAFPTLGILIKFLFAGGEGGYGREVQTLQSQKIIMLATFAATGLNLLGLTLPWIAATIYPEYRLTLANSSFLFNTAFTVINVFYIEHRFAGLIDQRAGRIHSFVMSVTLARLAALVVVGLSLLVTA